MGIVVRYDISAAITPQLQSHTGAAGVDPFAQAQITPQTTGVNKFGTYQSKLHLLLVHK